jgi:hypothetical protein
MQLCSKNDVHSTFRITRYLMFFQSTRCIVPFHMVQCLINHLFSTSSPKRDSVALSLRLIASANIYGSQCQKNTKRERSIEMCSRQLLAISQMTNSSPPHPPVFLWFLRKSIRNTWMTSALSCSWTCCQLSVELTLSWCLLLSQGAVFVVSSVSVIFLLTFSSTYVKLWCDVMWCAVMCSTSVCLPNLIRSSLPLPEGSTKLMRRSQVSQRRQPS